MAFSSLFSIMESSNMKNGIGCERRGGTRATTHSTPLFRIRGPQSRPSAEKMDGGKRGQVVGNEKSGRPVEKFNGDFGASFVREFAQRWVAGRRSLFFTARSSALLIFLREAEKACSPGLLGNR